MTAPPTIETGRLVLRGLAETDFPAVADFYASERSRFVGGPKRPDEAWRQLALEIGHWTLRGYGRLAVVWRDTGELAGIVGPWFPEGWPEPELGWDLMNGFEGRGIATEAAATMRDFCHDTLGWTTVISLVAHGNDGSAAVARRLGAIHETDMTHPMFGDMQIWRHKMSKELS